MLTPEVQAEILALHFAGQESVRGISNKLGINRISVKRVIERRSVNLVANLPIIDDASTTVTAELTKVVYFGVVASIQYCIEQTHVEWSR